MKNVKEFVVGFEGKAQSALYSKRAWKHPEGDGGIEKMTLPQARKEAKKLSGGRRVIFKLVPFEAL